MSETGTRELVDGRPAYRLVRREDIELEADAQEATVRTPRGQPALG